MRRRSAADVIGEAIANILYRFMMIGLAWIFAWVCKPDLSSGTVWFFALLFAETSVDLSALRNRRNV